MCSFGSLWQGRVVASVPNTALQRRIAEDAKTVAAHSGARVALCRRWHGILLIMKRMRLVVAVRLGYHQMRLRSFECLSIASEASPV